MDYFRKSDPVLYSLKIMELLTPTQSGSLIGNYILFFSIMLLPGCVSIHVTGANVKVHQGLGIVNVDLQPTHTEPIFVNTQGIGMIVGTRSLRLGFFKENVTSFSPAQNCHVVLVVETEQQFDALHHLMASNPTHFNHICMLSKEKTSWKP